MQDSIKIKEVYNKRAKVYDKLMSKIRYHSTLKALLNSIELDISKDSKILDLGCGTGLATQILSIRYPNSEIIGLDYSEEMLKLYQERFPSIKTIIGDFNQQNNFQTFPTKRPILFRPNSFNLIVSTGAVSEYGDIGRVIPFIYKLLKKNGYFINIGIKRNIMSIVTGKLWHYKPAGRKNLTKVCKKAGFQGIQNIKIPWKNFPNNITKFVTLAKKRNSS